MSLVEPSKVDASLTRELVSIFGRDRVSQADTDRIAYARDLCPEGQFWIRRGRLPHPPDWIAWAETEEEISELLRWANRRGVSVTPVGAGSGVTGGAVPLRGGVSLDLKRMNRIGPIDERSLLVRVQPGANGEVLERRLSESGFTLGHFPSSIYCSTVGGWISTRAAGQLSTKYGKIEDLVVSLRAVLPDGTPIATRTTPRSACGPDLDQMLIGSEGTLAVITEATLRLSRAAEQRLFSGFLFQSVARGLEAIRAVLQRGLRPAAVRLYDEVDTELTMQALGKSISGCLLIYVLEGPKGLPDLEQRACREAALAEGAKDLGEEPGRFWWEKRYAVSYQQSLILKNPGMIVDTIEVATTWSNLLQLYETMKAAIGKHIHVMAHFSHFYPEGGSIYFSVFGRPEEGPEEVLYKEFWKAAMDACVEAGGTISHHHGIGYLRAPWMEKEHGEAMQIYKKLKHALDPNGILNPGKMGL